MLRVGATPAPLRPGRVRNPGVVAGAAAAAAVRATLKMAPSAPSDDGCASAWRPAPTIVMACAPAWALVAVCPSLTDEPPVNCTVPKLSSGTTPPRPALGASWIHSADDSDEVYCTVR